MSSKIALIGPIKPYRGGIAQHTSQLNEALRRETSLMTVSFSSLYPSFLYPGSSDKEPGLEDYTEPGVDYLISAYDPLSLKRTAVKIAEQGCKVAILSWWTLIWQPGMAYLARALRKKGIKVIFLCHNLFDHDAGKAKIVVSKRMLSQADAYIVHSSDEEKEITEMWPDKPVLQRMLPIDTTFPDASDKLPKRGRLEILFFGFIRPYKGLEVLIEALAKLKDREVYLTVVGEPWANKEELKAKLMNAGVPNLELHLEYLDDKSAANYFDRADIVALPYITATGSAVVALAYKFFKPVLSTNVGGLKDAVIENETGWLVEPNAPGQIAEKIRVISREETQKMAKEIKAFNSAHDWVTMAKDITKFAESLLR